MSKTSNMDSPKAIDGSSDTSSASPSTKKEADSLRLAALCFDVLAYCADRQLTDIPPNILDQYVTQHQLKTSDPHIQKLLTSLRAQDKSPTVYADISARAVTGWAKRTKIDEQAARAFVAQACALQRISQYDLLAQVDTRLHEKDAETVWHAVAALIEDCEDAASVRALTLAFELRLRMRNSSNPAIALEHLHTQTSATNQTNATIHNSGTVQQAKSNPKVHNHAPAYDSVRIQGVIVRKELASRFWRTLSMISGWTALIAAARALSWLLGYRHTAMFDLSEREVIVSELQQVIGHEIGSAYHVWRIDRCHAAGRAKRQTYWPQTIAVALFGLAAVFGAWTLSEGMIAGDRVALMIGGIWLLVAAAADFAVFVWTLRKPPHNTFWLRIADQVWHLRSVEEQKAISWLEKLRSLGQN